MKKRLFSILLSLAMVLTMMPAMALTVFADEPPYAITNGTPDSAKEANHGYIAVDETAAEGDTVTVEAYPAEGYQLKSLTATPVAPTISTIADVLATVEGFPEDTAGETYPVTPSGAWSNGNGGFAFIYGRGNAFVLSKDSYTYGFLTTKVTKKENCYTATISYGSLTFNMENGILTNFEFTADPSKPNAANYVGTYTPANTPSPRLKPITPAKQQDGTYQFTMPGYAVTVTAEFEEIPVTIADILPDDFPLCVDVLPSNTWLNDNGINMMLIQYTLGLITTDGSKEFVLAVDIRTAILTKNGNYYTYTNNGVTTTFLMSDNGLESVKIEGLTGEYVDFNGTYGEQHAHSFTYTVNGGKLTATCTAGCDKGYDTTPLTLTLTAPASLVYDGKAKAFTFADGEADAWTGAGLELPKIYYYEKKDYPFYMGIDSAPTDAGGDYMVEITVNKKAARIYFTIDKATPYIKTNPEPTDIIYGKKLSDSTLFGGYVQVSSTDSSEVGGLFEWTNPDTVPGIDDSEVTEYDVTFTPADTDNFNTVSCKVKIKVNHTHAPVLVNGQAATETASGWKDYYECDCGLYFEDEDCTEEIGDETALVSWKTVKGAIAILVHTITPVSAQAATQTEAGFKAYYECKNCGKYYEDAEGKNEITDLSAWKAKGGKGYIPSGNEIAAAKTEAKAALDAENAKDPLTDETSLTNGKSSIDSAETLADIENAKNAAITAIQEAQATELANAKDVAKSALDTEEAKDPLTDKTALTNGKNSIDSATTKTAVEAAKNAAITAIQKAQATEHKDPKSPQTGDTFNMTPWIVLLTLSAMGLCACLVLRRKKN